MRDFLTVVCVGCCLLMLSLKLVEAQEDDRRRYEIKTIEEEVYAGRVILEDVVRKVKARYLEEGSLQDILLALKKLDYMKKDHQRRYSYSVNVGL